MRTWSPEQLDLRDGIAHWCSELSERHIERDGDTSFPWDKWKLICDSGLLGLPFDPEWGGLGIDLLTTMYVLEGLGEGCRDSGLSFSVATHMSSTGVPVQHFGSPSLKQRYLARLCSGELIGAHAISEPDAGSDALSMQSKATPEGDHFVLRGNKSFVSNGPIADVVVVYARTRPEGGPLGITAFLVDRDTPGFEVGQPLAKMGLKTAPMCELFLDECRVPAANVIGGLGRGFLILDYVMKWEILCSFIINVGEMQHRLERCIEYAKSRSQFGKRISSFQAIANKLVDMRIRLDTSRKWLYDTAERFAAGENVTMDVAISKLLTSEANVASSLSSIQIFGGNGYMSEYGIEKELRNAVASTIYSGTTEIQYNRIASLLGL